MSHVIGWTGAYTSNLPTTPFSESRKQALVECIKHRHYSFNHADHEFLDYCAPLYEDGKICVLNKHQFDEVMAEAYSEIRPGRRLMPIDTIKRDSIYDILFEKESYEKEWCEKNG